MNKEDIGDMAFPRADFYRDNGSLQRESKGMTLRDYFAAKAMQAFIPNTDSSLEDDALAAYRVADAMLKARQK